ncbi:MAG TPA: PBP1A family penicillin-binding protein [Thermoanaerobaculia bacterium]|nr:PBP1A family penicillin-binding protein [Thermoanaerobaculia bacterium]
MEWRSQLRRLDWRAAGRSVWDSPPRLLAVVLAVLYATVLFFGLAWSRCFFTACPNVGKLAVFQPGGAPVLLDRNGEVFADLAPAERAIVPLSSLPSHVPQAFIAVEDQRFYEHRGVDWRRVGGAVLANLRAGGFAQGFSTISMQLARNVFPERIPGEEQTARRKLLEIRVAQEIEHRYSKEEILELYLNNIYFGNRARGIEAAARQYFGRPAKDLTLAQAALLAALPKAPSHYDPRRHPDEALARRNLVLALMRDQGRIPKYLAEKAQREPLGIVEAPRQERTEAGLAPWFVEQVRRELEDRFGPNLYTRPLRIVTTLDSAAQRAAEEELRRQLKGVESGAMGAFQGPRYSSEAAVSDGGTPYLQGAAVMMDVHDGDVLAWVGGRDFSQSQFDRVAQARRQPGSAFKPFVYAAALADGFVLSQPLLDAPLKVKLADGQVWQPKNFSERYEGEISMRDALVRSKNVPTVRLADAVGLKAVTQVAHRVGIDEPIAPVPAIALGTTAVSPLELTAAYTGFASLGQAAEPRLILRVEDEKGKVVWRSEPRRHSVLDPGVAFLITDVLAESVVSGTGSLVQQTGLKAPAAGKTGTTNEGADAWFVGYTPEIAAGVWIGFDKPRPILDKATGGELAAPVWGRMLARVYQERPAPKAWTAPADVIPHWVDPSTGLVIKEGCAPQHGFARPELFLKGKEPAAYCPGKEAPPANPFPTDRRLLQRGQEERQEAERLAEQRAAEQRAEAEREAKQKEQERLAKLEQEKEEEKQEQARLAEIAREEQQKKEKLAAARKAAETEKERAALKAREERLAREEAAADRREAEIAAREHEKDRRAKEAAVREEARLQRLREQRNDEDVDRTGAREAAGPDLSGWWELTNTIASTNYAAYRGLRLTYRLQLEQDGDRLTGRGQKWAEDGTPVSAAARSPISVTGRIEGNKVVLQFTERGAKRSTTGSFAWTLAPNGNALRGTFWSTAADTSGGSVARRMR